MQFMQQSDACDYAKYQRAGQSARVRRVSFTEQDLKGGGANWEEAWPYE